MSWSESLRRWFQSNIDVLSDQAQKLPKPRLLLLLVCLLSAILPATILWQPWHKVGVLRNVGHDTQVLLESDHPIASLVVAAGLAFSTISSGQSASVTAASTEYRRRYRRRPPPHFGKWFDFIRDNDCSLVDEYDEINRTLQPFWGISPAAIRRNVKHALKSDEALMGIFIRDGKIKSIKGGGDWIPDTIRAVIETFVHLLPDMDLAFNLHDEPRVVIPHDMLTQLTRRAQDSETQEVPVRESWSPVPADLDTPLPDLDFITPFLDNSYQHPWNLATLSCPPISPARMLRYDGLPGADDLSAYTDVPIAFVRDRNLFTNICQSPTISGKLGIFNQPNAWSLTYTPTPIFSASKISSFHDILYPAPWYLAEKTNYNETEDPSWDSKKDTLYWRGTTTGGYSTGGAWRHWSRQRFVSAIEKSEEEEAWILEHSGDKSWSAKKVSQTRYRHLFDVHFSYLEQCSEEDCADQREYFNIVEPDPHSENWQHKFIADVDGHAFSGRFYSLLQSRSLTLKQALFREWHEDRIFPWVHYIPLGINNTDYLEVMRFLTEDEKGRQLAEDMAERSRDWASKALRLVDMHAYMFRLLLEYGRLVDDERETLGYAG